MKELETLEKTIRQIKRNIELKDLLIKDFNERLEAEVKQKAEMTEIIRQLKDLVAGIEKEGKRCQD